MNFKKILTVIVAVNLFASAGYCADMDLLARSIISSPQKMPKWAKSITESGELELPVLIKAIDAEAVKGEIKSCGGKVTSETGSILSARLGTECMKKLAASSAAEFIELTPPLGSKMNTARAAAEVDIVQDGSALGVPYDGKNVVVGIVDDALDYAHEDFGGIANTRIQYLSRTSDGTTVECTKRTIKNSSCQVPDGGLGYTHGTHVTGIASGGDSTYTGVAPQSDIMFIFCKCLFP